MRLGRPAKQFLLLTVVSYLAGVLGGCAVGPGKVLVKDTQQSFVKGDIISTAGRALVTFQEMVQSLAAAGVIYVGEQHTNAAHHDIQLQVLKACFKANPDLVVGMEMFDQTYQSVLDEWSRGNLDQQTFLEQVHWYANWRYDYRLYKEILDFILANNIHVVGLNVPPHIPPKIRVGGIHTLSAEEKKYLPRKLDTSNKPHRDYLKKTFERHKFKAKVNFEYFYLAQCVWEDGMAESIARNLHGQQMVVLVGNGHIINKFGIPERAFNRTKVPFRTIYPAAVGSKAELLVADYIWVTP